MVVTDNDWLIYFLLMEKKGIRTSKFIGGLIKKRRKELGISQEKLAETLGVTYQQIQRYENGSNRLNVENIQFVAKALSVPITYFFEPEHPGALKSQATTLPVEELALLKNFKKIKKGRDRETVLRVAQLAAKI
jgi:transcriptional regulator with XRE-family HTH domain